MRVAAYFLISKARIMVRQHWLVVNPEYGVPRSPARWSFFNVKCLLHPIFSGICKGALIEMPTTARGVWRQIPNALEYKRTPAQAHMSQRCRSCQPATRLAVSASGTDILV